MMDKQNESRERELFRALMRRPERYAVIQGLPKHYFREYADFFGGDSGAAAPVLISPAAAPVTQIKALGAECYALSSVPGMDREIEIRAYERAHAALKVAYSRMTPVESDLAQLCVDDDLPILAQCFFLAEAESFFAGAFPGRKVVLPLLSRDDSYRILGSRVDCAFFHVRGDFAEVQQPAAGSEPAGGPETFAVDAATLLDAIDTATANGGETPSIAPLAQAAGTGGIIINCSYTPEHFSFECLLDICGKLRDRGIIPVVVVKNDASAVQVKARGYDPFVLNERTPVPGGRRPPDAPLPRFREWPYSDWIRLAGWRRRANNLLYHYDLASRLVHALRPRAVLTHPYGSHSGRALRLAARRAGVPACTPILLGVAGHARGFPVMDRFSTFLVYGDEARELMTAFGVVPERIIVTGNPRYDAVVSHLDRRSEYRRAILPGRNDSTKIALVATTGLLELDKLWLDEACRSVATLGIRLLIKPHPSIGLAPYAKWLSGDPLVSGWEGSLEEAVAACDVMLTDYSSTGFEAILYGRPLIVVNFSAHEFSYRWEDEGVGVRVSNAAELQEQLRSVAEDCFAPEVMATQKRVVSRFNHLNDGRAGERIADLLAAARFP